MTTTGPERGSLKKNVYFVGDVVAVLNATGLDLIPQTIVNWMKAGKIKHYRLPGTDKRPGDRYVEHEDLVAWLRRNPEQWRKALHAVGEEPAPPPAPPAKKAR